MFDDGLTVTASTVKHLSFLHIPLIVIYGQTETHGGITRQTFSCEFPLMKTDFTTSFMNSCLDQSVLFSPKLQMPNFGSAFRAQATSFLRTFNLSVCNLLIKFVPSDG